MLIEIADLLHWFIGPIRTIDMIINGRIGRVLTIEWRLLFLLGAFFFSSFVSSLSVECDRCDRCVGSAQIGFYFITK